MRIHRAEKQSARTSLTLTIFQRQTVQHSLLTNQSEVACCMKAKASGDLAYFCFPAFSRVFPRSGVGCLLSRAFTR